MASKSRASIDTFRSYVDSDFARPNLFQVELNFPSALTGSATQGSATSDLKKRSLVLVKAANLPASTVGVIEVPFRGRTLKIAGDRTFEPWTVTVMNDAKFQLRSYFELWISKIQYQNENYSDFAKISDYQTSATVRQLGRQGDILRSYEFQGVFPTNVSAIDLAWESNDSIEEYTVEFQVQYWNQKTDTEAETLDQTATS
jgi:hypothetical protein